MMNYWSLSDAVLVAVRSDVMLIAAIAIISCSCFMGSIAKNRALAPEIRWSQALSRPGRMTDGPRKGAGKASTLVIVAFLGLFGALVLTLTGHPPSPLLSLGPAVVAATMATAVAVHLCRDAETRSIIADRGTRLLASSLFAEVSAALAVVITLAVVLHTEGLTAVSFLEIVAISLATRLAVQLSPWPGGIGVADATLLIPLTWIGVPVHAALSAVLIWRAGSLLAAMSAALFTRSALKIKKRSEISALSDRGRLLHRTLFAIIGVLPERLREVFRRRVFDALFSVSDDPWRYQTSNYEYRKRGYLLAAIPPCTTRLLEVGCAEGHNLMSIAQIRPDIQLVGVDISATAAALATDRTKNLKNILILGPGDEDRLESINGEKIDCVVLSEVLYYMGLPRSMRRNLAHLRTVMSPECHVIMLHGAADARMLHGWAARALDLDVVKENAIEDPTRPFIISIAQKVTSRI